MIRTIHFLVLISIPLFLGCSHKSIFKLEPDENKKYAFQYCGGQQWGYVKPLSDKKDGPYLGVYLENHISDDDIRVALQFVIQAKENTEIQFKDRIIKLLKNGAIVNDKPTNFWVIRGPQHISEKYPNTKYSTKQISPNEWQVRKKKMGGAFGELALDEPFTVKLDKGENREFNGNEIKVDLEKDIGELYIMSDPIIFSAKNDPNQTNFLVYTPEFIVNGIKVKESSYVFHFDRDSLLEKSKKANRCSSLGEIFRAARNKDSWIWWLYPEIK